MALFGLLLFGACLWTVGVIEPFGVGMLPALGCLVLGGILVATAGMVLLASRPSGRLEHPREEAAMACGSAGLGLAAIGFALSPQARWVLPAVVFAVGGLGLIAWSPQALGRRRAADR